MPGRQKTPDTQHNTDSMRTQFRVTDRQVKNLKAEEKSRIHYDEKLRGFGVRVYPSGRKSFVLNYYYKGRERRMVIGGYPEWTVLAARKQAEWFLVEIGKGRDPLEQRNNDRAAPTVQDMFERYEKDYMPKLAPRSAQDQRSMFIKSILPRLGSKKVEDVTFNDCEALHRHLTKDRPLRANRVIEVLRRAFNLAIKWGWLERNPASGIEKNPEQKRERYLSYDEIRRLLFELERHPQKTSCDAIRFILFTGCRRGEALSATWDQFDSELKVWTKPAATTKQRRLHRVPVSREVTKLLEVRKASAASEFVFESIRGRALTDIKKTWIAVTRSAGIRDARVHDLRHTFASIAVSQGQSLPVIGAMLGHSQPQTTARYAHLLDDPLVEATELISNKIIGALH
ncbi:MULTISPECIES: tyrosine-type recombinase/integrase [unclassified Hyphomonas]|uniref:tyrosine-type recombinase/integrase n=1 Tax=unclassified Hyphomonas TaxID=2630699 RepID=UPI000E8B2A19|nr:MULTISPECIES: tyrosine-type recombinase/integrase [unclassified Hyphomonas]HBJ41052.1 integrase [Hyphomonas sp.]HBT36916.1 integrase [Hyphomonas sp.]